MSQLKDLAKDYGAPFAIISHEEGSRYASLVSRDYTNPRSLDFQSIQSLDGADAIDKYCRTLSFEKLVTMKHDAYHQLMIQFYTTLSFTNHDDDAQFSCRLMGKNVTVTRTTLCDIFGFREGGLRTMPKNFEPVRFWREISDGRGDFKVGKTPCALIKDPILLLMHRYVSHVIFGRGDSSKVNMTNLFYLWCLSRCVRVDTPRFLIAAFKSVVTKKRPNMCLGNFITAIAVYFGVFDPLNTVMTVLPTRALDLTTTRNAFKEGKCYRAENKEVFSSFFVRAEGEDTNEEAIDDDQSAGVSTTPPAAAEDSWKLMSREMEQMQTRMNDGFNDLKAGFDGLEKKFNAMCAHFRTFQQEWAGLRPEKLESEIYETRFEKLSTRIKKVEEGVAKISSIKVVDLANLVNHIHELGTFGEGENDGLENRSMPDVDAENAAGFLASNSIGSKGLSKNGEQNAAEPWTRDDDIAFTVKNSPRSPSDYNPLQPANNDCTAPLGSVAHASGKRLISGEGCFYKTACSSSAAARDIIEILDSDDETNPTGAAENSKRVLCSNEMNIVQRSKRNRTESLNNLFAFSTTKVKKEVRTVDEDDALIIEKRNEVLKSSRDIVDCSQTGKCVEGARDSENGLNDGVSADSEDESLLDSIMDDLIVSLQRENCATKFMYEADMLRAFQQDEELCLNAVCALYRRTIFFKKIKRTFGFFQE